MTRIRSLVLTAALLTLAGCGGGRSPEAGTSGATPAQAESASPREIDSPRAAIELGIGTVYQHLTLVPTLSVLENLRVADSAASRSIFCSMRPTSTSSRPTRPRCRKSSPSILIEPASGGQLADYLESWLCLYAMGYDPMLDVLSLTDAARAVVAADPVERVEVVDRLRVDQPVDEPGRGAVGEAL